MHSYPRCLHSKLFFVYAVYFELERDFPNMFALMLSLDQATQGETNTKLFFVYAVYSEPALS